MTIQVLEATVKPDSRTSIAYSVLNNGLAKAVSTPVRVFFDTEVYALTYIRQ